MLTGLMAVRSSPLSLCPSPTLGWLLLSCPSCPCTGGLIAHCPQTRLLGPQMGAWPTSITARSPKASICPQNSMQ